MSSDETQRRTDEPQTMVVSSAAKMTEASLLMDEIGVGLALLDQGVREDARGRIPVTHLAALHTGRVELDRPHPRADQQPTPGLRHHQAPADPW